MEEPNIVAEEETVQEVPVSKTNDIPDGNNENTVPSDSDNEVLSNDPETTSDIPDTLSPDTTSELPPTESPGSQETPEPVIDYSASMEDILVQLEQLNQTCAFLEKSYSEQQVFTKQYYDNSLSSQILCVVGLGFISGIILSVIFSIYIRH